MVYLCAFLFVEQLVATLILVIIERSGQRYGLANTFQID